MSRISPTCLRPVLLALLLAGAVTEPWAAPVAPDPGIPYTVALPDGPSQPPASIRENAIAWHPTRNCYYLVADVIPVDSPHHPNTYETELYLWRSDDLVDWTCLGVVVPKGSVPRDYHAHGVASPSALAWHEGRLWVAFSARKTARFDQRGIGLAWSGTDPDVLPWTTSPTPISDLPGEDDDPGVLAIPGDKRLHVYHRATGPGGYRIVHTASSTPQDPRSWTAATDVTARPEGVRAQELTGVAWIGDAVHLFVIEQGDGVPGIQIAHLIHRAPEGKFMPHDPAQRYLTGAPPRLAYGGHFTPVVRDGHLIAGFWTVFQEGPRYGLVGYPIDPATKEPVP